MKENKIRKATAEEQLAALKERYEEVKRQKGGGEMTQSEIISESMQLSNHLRMTAESVFALTSYVRDVYSPDIDRMWLCDTVESDLAWLRLALVLPTGGKALSRFVADGDSSFYLDESDRIGERLAGEIADLIDGHWVANHPFPQWLKEKSDVVRWCADEINTHLGRLTLATPCKYGWEKEWPTDPDGAQFALEEHCRKLAYSTFATMGYLRGRGRAAERPRVVVRHKRRRGESVPGGDDDREPR